MRGPRLVMAFRAMRAMAMIAQSHRLNVGAVAEEAAPNPEKLRADHGQNAEREHERSEMRAEFHSRTA